MPDHSAVSIRPGKGGRAARSTAKDYEPLLADSKDEDDSKKPGLSWGRLCAEARIVRCRMLIGTIFLFLSSASNLALPALFGIIIDALARKDQESLNVASITLIVVTATGAVFAMIRAFLFNSSGQIVVAGLRSKLFG
jgi:ABC-type bacteriocin/lantibiotic exporter with double-glycine peptidase domain